MKIVAAIARYLLGLMFLVFGLNNFLHFIPMGPPPPGLAGRFSTALIDSRYMLIVGAFMVLAAVLLIINRYVPLALTLLGPILVNILIFHILMAPASIGPGAVATILWFAVARVWSSFVPLFSSSGQS